MTSYYKRLINLYETHKQLRELDKDHPLLDFAQSKPNCKTLLLHKDFHTRYSRDKDIHIFYESTSRYIDEMKQVLNQTHPISLLLRA